VKKLDRSWKKLVGEKEKLKKLKYMTRISDEKWPKMTVWRKTNRYDKNYDEIRKNGQRFSLKILGWSVTKF